MERGWGGTIHDGVLWGFSGGVEGEGNRVDNWLESVFGYSVFVGTVSFMTRL